MKDFMKQLFSFLVFCLTLAGCASQEEVARQSETFLILEKKLIVANRSAVIFCPTKQVCDKAFSLTKVYINEHSDMKVQMSDDTMISTYNAVDYDRIAMEAIKTPSVGDSSNIKLVVRCKNMSEYSVRNTDCMWRAIRIYTVFRPFVESRL